ncbi:outer membrane beta-barrel protein [Pseudidiomarina insulisalsae]|uniref:Outer membrane protein beta-barrel domain-containing protein n=1 Tax=Pseudidiomarina insulisalsae TaxID=575789 RepID=A0A432YQI7_9GAMM|nr:outer membrane beta-barrel protein [Pseudidiomarina insulisalsae]RUO63635.1 hypothetical protein CWI71_00800 [Pseudidiomarina insulisalsae]
MNKLISAAALAAVLTTPAAFASERPVYDYVTLNYLSTDIDEGDLGFDISPDGFEFEVSKRVSDYLYFIGSYNKLSDTVSFSGMSADYDVAQLRAGVGLLYSASKQTDLFFEPTLVHYNVDVEDMDSSDTGYGVKIGFNHAFSSVFHLKGFLSHVNVDDVNDNTYGAEGRILFTERFHGIIGAEANSDDKLFRIGLSLTF